MILCCTLTGNFEFENRNNEILNITSNISKYYHGSEHFFSSSAVLSLLLEAAIGISSHSMAD